MNDTISECSSNGSGEAPVWRTRTQPYTQQANTTETRYTTTPSYRVLCQNINLQLWPWQLLRRAPSQSLPPQSPSHSPASSLLPPPRPKPILSSTLGSSVSPNPKTQRRPVFCASASTAFEVDQAPAPPLSSKLLPFRVGHGFDLHRLEPGYPLIIGGIDIPHDRGCEAHSDGDVLLHCVVDAILGALGLPDIGQIFPDSDPKWRGAASSVFIKELIFQVRLMHEAGYEIGNLDATLILQRPKLSPHKEVMRANLAKLLGADPPL
ncbi:2-C-methyl-D-erythritol 2,4-cyclodiphosphate synthase [Pyrus ussuriensis x Pyrus communis]|uniref:2-C-methyl-D-erythritol 2,4-cyclodiphosphate synthase n=1 Tax=Pyrus ussuriensis x Pyrus communis TaxID=2448454 RepID=A0A5N5FZW3_9ROSA|nr:2-C-methyl-D-erythritol 2,4-cyclodiphosphate synthase [Pyrus ussuriensis x Pyrus communis]